MQYEPTNLWTTLLLAVGSLFVGGLTVYQIATHGAIMQYIADLQAGGTGSVGFVKGDN